MGNNEISFPTLRIRRISHKDQNSAIMSIVMVSLSCKALKQI